MAHKLNFNGTWSFASHAEKAWHGLGQVVENAMTSDEAIKLANLDYQVDKAMVSFISNQEMTYHDVDGFYATYRTDTKQFLGLVKSRYEIVQNSDAFAFFDAIIDRGEAIFETAGALGNGERIFLTAKLPEDFEVAGEKIEQYIMLTNSHDGSSPVIAGFTNIRVVCNNTLQAALSSLTNKVSITHISGAKDKVKEASRVMGIQSKYAKSVGDIFNSMADHKMTEGQINDFITKIMTPEYLQAAKNAEEQKEMSTRLKNTIDATLQFTLTHPTQVTDPANKTLWGAYNGISGYFNYIKPFKSGEDKFKAQFFGQGNIKMLKAFEEANSLLVK